MISFKRIGPPTWISLLLLCCEDFYASLGLGYCALLTIVPTRELAKARIILVFLLEHHCVLPPIRMRLLGATPIPSRSSALRGGILMQPRHDGIAGAGRSDKRAPRMPSDEGDHQCQPSPRTLALRFWPPERKLGC